MTHNVTAGWQDYIAREIKQAEQRTLRIAMEAVGEVLTEERKKLRAEFESRLQAEIAILRIEFLADRLDQEHGTKRLKVVPSGSLIP